MKRAFYLSVALVLSLTLAGCGKGSGSEADGPAKTVTDFLAAVKRGDDAVAGSLLTQLAQQKTAEMDMDVRPQGSDTATFVVGEVKIGEAGEAHVASSWTDFDHEGNPRTDNITWIVKQSEGAWRIAGMAAKVFADQPEIVLNFENPQEMIEQQRLAEEQAYRQATEQDLEARRQEDPFQNNVRQ